MLVPSDHKDLRREHGFRRRMRRLIRTSALPWRAKADLCAVLAGSGSEAAWELYKQYSREDDNGRQ